MTTDAELAVLQEKVKRLSKDRDIALRLADRTSDLLRETKNQKDYYQTLWQNAEHRLNLIEVLQGKHMPKKRRSWWRLW